MSDSTNINNELDQYGVWVKNPPHTDSIEDSLPDFSFLENAAAQNEQTTFENDDTALSADELLNITNSIPANEVVPETPAPDTTDEVSLDDFMSEDFSIEEDKPAAEEAPAVKEDSAPSFDSMPDGEIDLDSFMDSSSSSPDIPDGDVDLGAFFDSSDGPALNHEDGDINLDDFLGDSGLSSNPEPKAEEIIDEKPMDIDLSFDDSMVVETDEDGMNDNSSEFDTITVEDTNTGTSEEVDLGDFDASFTDETPHDFKPEMHSDISTTEVSADSFGTSEEIDLSDFGIEEDSGNQNVVMPGSGGPEKKKNVVDYEMTVSTDDDSDSDEEETEIKENIDSSEKEETVSIETIDISSTNSSSEEDSFALDSFVPETENIEQEEAAVEEQSAPSEEISVPDEEISLDDFGFNDVPSDEENTASPEEEIPVPEENAAVENVEEETVSETPAESTEGFVSFDDTPSITEEVNLNDFTEFEVKDNNQTETQEEIQPEIIEDLNVPPQPVFTETESAETEEIEEEDIEPSEFIPESIETETLEINPETEDTNSESSYSTTEIMDDNIFEGVEQTLPEEVAASIDTKEQETTVVPKEEIKMDEFEETETTTTNTVSVDNDILLKISEELSSLRQEINGLKNEFANIRNSSVSVQPAADSAVSEEIIAPEVNIPEEEPVEESSGGFFADTDEDDTISISGTELDSILTENEEEEQSGGFFSDSEEDDTIALSGSELDNILNNAEFSTENAAEDIVEQDTVTEDTAVQEEPVIEDTVTDEYKLSDDSSIEDQPFEDDFEGDSEINFDENLEEPVLEETSQYEAENIEETEAEIDVPKNDDILVESDNTDLMDTQVTTDEPIETEVPVEEAVEEMSVEVEGFDDKPVVVTEENPLSTPVDLFEDEKASPITDSNIDYLSEDSDFTPAEDEVKPEETNIESKTDTIPGDMKEEIKSVLSYMDQLLENLPEDKITEFAQSDEFEIYKKLFVELGLA